MVICKRCAEDCMNCYGYGRIGREAIAGWMDRHHGGPKCQLDPDGRIEVDVRNGAVSVVSEEAN